MSLHISKMARVEANKDKVIGKVAKRGCNTCWGRTNKFCTQNNIEKRNWEAIVWKEEGFNC